MDFPLLGSGGPRRPGPEEGPSRSQALAPPGGFGRMEPGTAGSSWPAPTLTCAPSPSEEGRGSLSAPASRGSTSQSRQHYWRKGTSPRAGMCSGRRRLTGNLELPSAQLPTPRSPPLPSRKKRPITHPTRTHCLRLSRMREASPAGSPWGRDGRGSRWHISGGRARALLWSIASRGPAGRTCWAGTSSAPGGGGRAQEWGEGRERGE